MRGTAEAPETSNPLRQSWRVPEGLRLSATAVAELEQELSRKLKSALHRFALFAEGASLLDFLDVFRGEGNLTGVITKIRSDLSDSIRCLDRYPGQRLNVRSQSN